jgi:hypothetical protein
MLRAKLCNESVPRIELDERAREARLGLERIERQLLPRAAVTCSRLRQRARGGEFGRAEPAARLDQRTAPAMLG